MHPSAKNCLMLYFINEEEKISSSVELYPDVLKINMMHSLCLFFLDSRCIHHSKRGLNNTLVSHTGFCTLLLWNKIRAQVVRLSNFSRHRETKFKPLFLEVFF